MYSQNGNSSSGSQSPQPVESSHHPSRTIKRGSWAQSDEEDSEEEESKPTFSKRKNSKASTSSNSAVNDMSSFDKDQRKLARMIRNRNAAQASRDRKKEYTQTLELRVAELESQLLPSSNNNNSSTNNNSNSQQINNNPPTQPTRQRQQKRSRSSSNTSESLPLFNLNGSLLEEQNETLRSQLYSEQMESARLRLKLESLEFKFNKMEELIPNNPVILPLHFSSFPSTTELAFQPIFSFASSTSLLEEEELDIKPIISYEDEPSSPSASSHSSMESESIIKTLLPEQASLQEFSIINHHDDYVSPPSSLPSSPSYSDDSYFSSNRSSITSLDINNSTVEGAEDNIGAVFSEWVTGLDLDDDHVRIKKEEEDVTMEFFNFDLLNDESTSNTLVLC